MAANTIPIYPNVCRASFGTVLTTANTAKDGTGTVVTIFTAGSNGSRVDKIQGMALGTNVATVLRLFINNGSDPTTATNNVLFREYTCAATTLSEVAALVQAFSEVFTNLVLPAGYKINATIGTTIAAGIICSAFGGDY